VLICAEIAVWVVCGQETVAFFNAGCVRRAGVLSRRELGRDMEEQCLVGTGAG